MEILVGRDCDSNVLGLLVNGKYKKDSSYQMPNTISRIKPNEGTAHCLVFINDISGQMSITNLNPQNSTYVDGEEITCKTRISEHSIVSMGADQYRLDLKKLLKNVGFERPYSIKHLEKEWNKYDKTLLKLQIDQQKNANKQKLQGLLSLLSTMCVIIPSKIPQTIRALFVVAALGVGIYFFVKGNKADNTFVMKKRNLDDEFREIYVCPKCGYFLGFTSYENVEYKGKCSHCNCKFIS
jgi:hypothetical protein